MQMPTPEVLRVAANLSGHSLGRVLVVGAESGKWKSSIPTSEQGEKFCFLDTAAGGVLPLPDQQFDAIVSIGYLEYIPNIQNTLSELRRILKESGVLIVAIPRDRDEDQRRLWFGTNLMGLVESLFQREVSKQDRSGGFRIVRFHKRASRGRRQARKVSVVIPVFNEVQTIEALVSRVLAAPLDGLEREVVLVDDGSRDGTRDWLSKISDPRVRIFYHERNRGKGAALRTGFAHVSGDVVIVQDADLEYCPEEYPLLLRPMLEGCAQVVYGSRFKGRDSNSHSSMTFFLGGQVVTWAANLLFNLRLTDEPTCYKVFWADLLPRLDLRCEKFEFCPEFTAKVARLGIRIMEVPISYRPRTAQEGKKIGWRDGIEAIQTLVKYRFWNHHGD